MVRWGSLGSLMCLFACPVSAGSVCVFHAVIFYYTQMFTCILFFFSVCLITDLFVSVFTLFAYLCLFAWLVCCFVVLLFCLFVLVCSYTFVCFVSCRIFVCVYV